MIKSYKFFPVLILLLVLLNLVSSYAQAEVAIITNPGVKEIGMSKKDLTSIYLGKLKQYSNGLKIKAVDLPKNSDSRKKFYKSVLNKSGSEINRYWSKLKYTGKGKPPKRLGSDRDVVKWVATTEGAIGYVDGKYLNKSVKIVLILP